MGFGSQWRDYFQYLRWRMVRQKEADPGDMKTELRRCLSTAELTCLGVGNTIGVGIYILLGSIAKEQAGPSTILCFIIAIGVTMLNALVYAEFSSSVTQTGASYTFLYKVGGEFIAFLTGWLMIMSSLCSGCVGARAWSGLLDSFFDNALQNFSKSTIGEIQFGQPFAEHLDLVAFAFQAAITLIVSCNVRCSSILTSVLSVVTVSVLLFVAGAGLAFGDAANFLNEDHGGFFPFGISGVIKGSSLAVYACSGFEVVSMSAEEAKNPQKSVPRATILELVTVACVYVAAAIGVLFLIPYWLIDTVAPLPSAFDYTGMVWGKFIVTLGPLFSFTNLQMLSLFGVSRMLYRMAGDGLFFQWFLHVNKKTGVPVNSIVFVGIFTSVLSLIFDLSFLVEITILLMLITYMFLGSALIKLKVTKPKSYSQIDDNSKEDSSSSNVQSSDRRGENSQLARTQYSLVENGSLNNLADFGESVAVNEEEEGDLTSYSISIEKEGASGNDNNNGLLVFDLDDQISHENEIGGLGNDDSDDSDGEENDILFKKETHSKSASKKLSNKNKKLSNKNRMNEDNNITSTTTSTTVNDVGGRDKTKPSSSLRLRIADKCFPLIPGALSFNTVILMHWLCCVGLAVQVNYGWRDLMNGSLMAMVAMAMLVFVLVLLTFLLWVNRVDDPGCSFQTPAMPLIPTLSIVFSCVLFFSSAKTLGFVEMVVLVIAGSILYCILVLMDLRSQQQAGSVSQETEQSMSLIGADEGSDNDEL